MLNAAHTPLEFFGETLAAAGGSKFTGEKYIHLLEEIFVAAKGDHQIEISVVFRKGNDVFLIGMQNGEVVHDRAGIRRLLTPVMDKL